MSDLLADGQHADYGDTPNDAKPSVGYAGAAAKDDDEAGGIVIDIPRDNPALRGPQGHQGLFKALQMYLIRLEYELWGVLDKGWGRKHGAHTDSSLLSNVLLLSNVHQWCAH